MDNNGFSDEEEIEFKYQYTYTRVPSEQHHDDDDEDEDDQNGYAYFGKEGKLDSSDSEAEAPNKFQSIPSDDDETNQTADTQNNNNAQPNNGVSQIVTEEIVMERVETFHTTSTRTPFHFPYLPNQREPVSEEQLRREAMQNFDDNYQREVNSVQPTAQKVELSEQHKQDIKEAMKGIKLNFEPTWAAKFNSKNWSDTVNAIKKSNNED